MWHCDKLPEITLTLRFEEGDPQLTPTGQQPYPTALRSHWNIRKGHLHSRSDFFVKGLVEQ